ncbi:MAG: signal recognition particle-docking protein FtsY [Chloroflexi bacterium]|nr:signal recognition particle-docking protein FtsY [Chloroflexota bacterium]
MSGQRADLKASLGKTRQSFFGRIAALLRGSSITEDTWEELETMLIQADVGARTATGLVESLREHASERGAKTTDALQSVFQDDLTRLLSCVARPYLPGERLLHVVLVVGVNGSGKTTSIAKLAKFHKSRGDRVLIAAADTFRAAAIDQLAIWGERIGVDVIAHQPGADPGAVVYDAIQACRARNANVLIIDTAGRLHTKFNLMQELAKISGVARKQVHQAPHETLLVLDATTGQNALSQAAKFNEMVGVSGVVLTKLDSTAKGGMVFAIAEELKLPVLFVTTGETVDDLAVFDPRTFVQGLFSD